MIDTLKFVRRMQSVGMPEAQAAALGREANRALESNPIDMLKMAGRLVEAGFPRGQAEAIAEVFFDMRQGRFSTPSENGGSSRAAD